MERVRSGAVGPRSGVKAAMVRSRVRVVRERISLRGKGSIVGASLGKVRGEGTVTG